MTEMSEPIYSQNGHPYIEYLKGKGTYTLVIHLPSGKNITIGETERKFSDGYYAYTGSAFGTGSTSLINRILRHLRKDKKKRWHIDYLLSDNAAKVVKVVAANTEHKMECEINCFLRDQLQATIPTTGFGSSDCPNKCESHLLYLGKRKNIAEEIVALYAEKIDSDIYELVL